jgi:phage-related protein
MLVERRNELLKPLEWMGTSYKDLLLFPRPAVRAVGFALDQAQRGERADNVKVMQGFGGASVLEVVEDHQTDTYRAVYTVRFDEAIYVLHCFQKKSKRGIETPKPDKDIIARRLKLAAERHRQFAKAQK